MCAWNVTSRSKTAIATSVSEMLFEDIWVVLDSAHGLWISQLFLHWFVIKVLGLWLIEQNKGFVMSLALELTFAVITVSKRFITAVTNSVLVELDLLFLIVDYAR